MVQRSLPAPRTPDPLTAPPVRWGILAPGWIARQFATALRQGTRQEIVAVGSRNLDRARAFADEYGAPAAYGSYDELVARPTGRHRLRRLAALRAPPTGPACPGGRQTRPGREGVHPQRRRGPRSGRLRPGQRACSCSRACGADSCRTTTSSPRRCRTASSARSPPSSPTTANASTPTAPNGCRTQTSPVAPCSTSASTRSPSPTSCSARSASITATGTLTDRGVDSQETVTVTSATGALGVLHASMLAASACTASICGTEGPAGHRRHLLPADLGAAHDRDGVLIDRHDPGGDVAHQGLRYEAAEAARCLDRRSHRDDAAPARNHRADMAAMDEVRHQLGVRFPDE